jgi:hypothetical protein
MVAQRPPRVQPKAGTNLKEKSWWSARPPPRLCKRRLPLVGRKARPLSPPRRPCLFERRLSACPITGTTRHGKPTSGCWRRFSSHSSSEASCSVASISLVRGDQDRAPPQHLQLCQWYPNSHFARRSALVVGSNLKASKRLMGFTSSMARCPYRARRMKSRDPIRLEPQKLLSRRASRSRRG